MNLSRNREALALRDLASKLDAGLPGALDTDGVTTLRAAGVQLDPIDRAVLTAAQEGGFLGDALRRRATTRENRARLGQKLLARLAYPTTVALMAIAVSALLWSLGIAIGPWPTVFALSAAALVLVSVVLLRVGLRTDRGFPTNLPWLSDILNDAGEVPYLQAMADLYGAGITLTAAHPLAAAAAPTASVRRRLLLAQHVLNEGRPLTEALTRANALHAETRDILATGELSGGLEDAFVRAATRRAEVLERRSDASVRALGAAVYGLAVLAVVATALGFYSVYFSRAMGR